MYQESREKGITKLKSIVHNNSNNNPCKDHKVNRGKVNNEQSSYGYCVSQQ